VADLIASLKQQTQTEGKKEESRGLLATVAIAERQVILLRRSRSSDSWEPTAQNLPAKLAAVAPEEPPPEGRRNPELAVPEN